ncbi:serine-type D-Ala-D-Ala carboxypeptidase [Clostridia bacterium]|nr:serine-type D-Ala-D-Ala carboxypeptidase [Clostridia bacterium]
MKLLYKKRLFLFFVIAAVLTAALPLAGQSARADAGGRSFSKNETEAAADSIASSCAESMTVMEARSGRILNSLNPDKRLPMASTTKVVTAIVVIENCDLNTVVKIPAEAVGVEGSSIYLEKDEPMTVEALLYGLMLQSGNDCAAALAIHAAGSVEKFAGMMNGFAQKVGAVNSHFMNPHGLHHKDHYTTARDLCRISCYAMGNPAFKRIVGSKEYKTTWVNRDYGRRIHNKNKILFQYEGGNGVKTGFTRAAGRCLVAAAERDGMQLVAVVLNCGPMFPECMRLMDEGFKKYKLTEILPAQKHLGELSVINGRKPAVRVYSYKSLFYPLAEGEIKTVKFVCELPEKLTAPVEKHQTVGKIKIVMNGKELLTDNIYAMEEVRAVTLNDRLGDLLREWKHTAAAQ